MIRHWVVPYVPLLVLFFLPILFLSQPQEPDDPIPQLSPPLSKDAVTSLAALAAIPPPVPPSPMCQPPPLPSLASCTDQAFSGQLLAKPRKLALMLLFGFEVDTLEIQLRECHDLVDVIFMVEATVSHRGVRGAVVYNQECLRTGNPLFGRGSSLRRGLASLTSGR